MYENVQVVCKVLILVLILGLVSFPVTAEDADNVDLETVPLYIGLQYDYELSESLKGKSLKFEGTYSRYTSLKYNRSKGALRFNPRRKGIGVINIKDDSGKIVKKLSVKVRKTDLRETANEIQSLLRTVDGINVKILNNRVVVDGEIVVPRDMRRIHDVVKEYKGMATSLVTLSPIARSKIAKFMEKEINDPNITVRSANRTFILEGFVDKKEEKNKAEAIATLYLPDHVVDVAVVDQKVQEFKYKPILNNIVVREKKPEDTRQKLVQIVVHYVELNKDYVDSFRFQWMPSIKNDSTEVTFYSGSGGGLGQLGGLIAGTINNFLPKLNWAKSFGFARILHSASVTTENGQKATITAGKTFPAQTPVNAAGGQDTQPTPTGVVLNLTPIIIGPMKDSIQLKVDKFEVNNLVGMSNGKPIVTSRTLTTQIHVQNGLSAVLGGIISNKAFSDYNRAPDQQQSTPLFSFLSSKSFHRAQNQFIVFVTPIIKSSASSGVNRIKKKFKISGS